MKKTYTRFGIASELDLSHPVYIPCRTGGYENTGHRVGDTLSDGRTLVMGKKTDWRTVWKRVYKVKTN